MKGPPFLRRFAIIGPHVTAMDIQTQLLLGLGFMIAVANCLALLAFGVDKRRAERGEWRIPEGVLLKLALLGGWPGAKLGQALFRHKTRKQPFAGRLNVIGALQMVCVVAGFGMLHAPMLDFDKMKSMAIAAIAPTTAPEDVVALSNKVVGGDADAPEMPRRFGPGSDDKSAINRLRP